MVAINKEHGKNIPDVRKKSLLSKCLVYIPGHDIVPEENRQIAEVQDYCYKLACVTLHLGVLPKHKNQLKIKLCLNFLFYFFK